MWTLKALGGSGQYKWKSRDEDIVIPSFDLPTSDLGVILGNKIGRTLVEVFD